MKKTLISFVIPCYRSEKTINMVVDEIIQTYKLKPEDAKEQAAEQTTLAWKAGAFGCWMSCGLKSFAHPG